MFLASMIFRRPGDHVSLMSFGSVASSRCTSSLIACSSFVRPGDEESDVERRRSPPEADPPLAEGVAKGALTRSSVGSADLLRSTIPVTMSTITIATLPMMIQRFRDICILKVCTRLLTRFHNSLQIPSPHQILHTTPSPPWLFHRMHSA